MKLLLDQGERVRHGLETQVTELQDKLKQAQGPEPAKEVLMKVGRWAGDPAPASFQLEHPQSVGVLLSMLSGRPNRAQNGGFPLSTLEVTEHLGPCLTDDRHLVKRF